MVAHLWANQSQNWARNGHDTFSFRGPTLYSWVSAIGEITPNNLNGKPVVLLSKNHWGNRTGSHLSSASWALNREDVVIFHVQYPKLDAQSHADNVADLFDDYQHNVEQLLKPNVYSWVYDDTLMGRK